MTECIPSAIRFDTLPERCYSPVVSPFHLTKFLTVNEAARQTGRSTSSIRRIIYPILKDDHHPDRSLVQPSPEQAKELRLRGENFPWKLSEQLLERDAATGKKPTSAGVGGVARQESAATQQLIGMLQRELDTKNEQIAQLNERLREGNILIGSFQKQLALSDPKQHEKQFVDAQPGSDGNPKDKAVGPGKRRWLFGRIFH